MVPSTTNFEQYLRTWFDEVNVSDAYVEASENAATWVVGEADGTTAEFRDELAAHIRDSSYPPDEYESQWTTDEWLRGIWYDAFGPEAPPGDPFVVPAEAWGRTRISWYMLLAVRRDAADSSPGASEWLRVRGLDFADIDRAKAARRAGTAGPRPEPPGWFDRLQRLTDEGYRMAQPGDHGSP
ncbi:MAG TPA: hypothetical protein VIP77_00300 [Jiangellaceae bacterium]